MAQCYAICHGHSARARGYGVARMRETDADIERLQQLMHETLSRAGPHMVGIVTPERRLRASQLVRFFSGMTYVAFASVTPAGEPRASFGRSRSWTASGRCAQASSHQPGRRRYRS